MIRSTVLVLLASAQGLQATSTPPVSENDGWRVIVQLGAAAAGGLLGALAGAQLASRRDEAARRFAFVERQVTQFYSPLVGRRREIQEKSELRARIEMVENTTYQDLIRGKSPEAIEIIRKKELPKYFSSPYNNRQLFNELLPAYREMLNIFRDFYWLAEPSTLAYYQAFSEYMEIWNRWEAKVIAPNVVQRLGHEEQSLQPFYADLEQTLKSLRSKLSKGKA
jgi:hypothetical protein